MPKFFVDENQVDIENNKIIILGQDVNHIKNVLRISSGENIEIATKSEKPNTFLARVDSLSNNRIECSILEMLNNNKEANIEISVFQGIPKSDKMELIIQKCTELGVSEFTPLELKRCISKIEGKDIKKKTERWQKIAEIAAKQCGRDIIPKVNDKINLNVLCSGITEKFDVVLVAYEMEGKTNLKKILRNSQCKKIAIVIGPEGGFEEDEIEILKTAGAKIVSIGKRILRTETAPIVLTSIIMYEIGDIGG